MNDRSPEPPGGLSRRGFLQRALQAFAAASLAAQAGCQGGGRQPLVPAQSGAAAPGQAVPSLPAMDPLVLVLKRTRFGISQQDYEDARALGIDAYLDRQFAFQELPNEAELAAARRFPSTELGAAALYAAYDGERRAEAVAELRAKTLYLASYSERQLYEVMVDFWSNHFNIPNGDGDLQLLKSVDDREVVRAHAFGRFRELLFASARSPAMLVYLDNASNTRAGPNENYARELMELHTLGIDGGYTEQDIVEVARCFTGWTVNPRSHEFQFRAQDHDDGEKWVLGQRIAAGGGVEDGEQVLDILAAHPATARFIAGKLARRFVADQAPAALVERLAGVFQRSDGDVYQLLRALLSDAEFLAHQDAKAQRPLEFVCSAVRALAPDPSAYHGPDRQAALNRMGQVPHSWHAPDGFPDDMQYWISAAGFMERWQFALDLAESRLDDRSHIEDHIEQTETATSLVDRLSQRLIRRPLSAAHRQLLIDFAGEGQAQRQLAGSRLRNLAEAVAALLLAAPYHVLR